LNMGSYHKHKICERTRTDTHGSVKQANPASSAENRQGQVQRVDAHPCELERALPATEIATDVLQSDPGLAAVVEAWDRLPEAIRQGVLAMVKAST